MSLSETFRKNLRTALLERGLTQKDLAAKSGVSRVYICRILTGKHEPTLATCDALARGVKLPAEKLLSKSA